MHALATAAVRLGASHVSVALKADNDETSLERVASILREVMAEVEQHEQLMFSPKKGSPMILNAWPGQAGGGLRVISPPSNMPWPMVKPPCVDWPLRRSGGR